MVYPEKKNKNGLYISMIDTTVDRLWVLKFHLIKYK